MTTNSFGARDRLEVGDAAYEIFRLDGSTARRGCQPEGAAGNLRATRTAPW
jgi:hypothetical protein